MAQVGESSGAGRASIASAPISPRCMRTPRVRLDEARPDAVAAPAPDRSAHDAGERRRPRRSRQLRRVRPPGHRRAAPAPRARRPDRRTPADGLVGGVGTRQRPLARVVMSYDYTVLAGTQGMQNHRKKDRLFELAERLRLPVVFFTEGGGGRPGDTDGRGVAGLDCMAFALFGRAERARAARRASRRAAASPATPRCSAAATSSSRPRTRTSAWAVRR